MPIGMKILSGNRLTRGGLQAANLCVIKTYIFLLTWGGKKTYYF